MQPSLSFIDILTRNLFLLTVMCICIGLGVVVHLLNIESLDTYFIQIKSERLDFIFFIGVAACYISLLFILIEKYWLNFFAQLLSTIIIFILLIFIFNPVLKVKFYLFDGHGEFSTRSWETTEQLPFIKMVGFSWLQMPDNMDQLFPDGVICPESYSRYYLSFVFTSYRNLPIRTYREQQGKLGINCNQATAQLLQSSVWASREQALLNKDYQYFLTLDANLADTSYKDKPLALLNNQLPNDLKAKIAQLYSGNQNSDNQIVIAETILTSSVIRELLE